MDDAYDIVLSASTDQQLRAECERRKMSVSGPGITEETWNSVRRERDEWKRRAETAEGRVGLLERRIEGGYLPHIATLRRQVFGEHYIDPLDLLADDAK